MKPDSKRLAVLQYLFYAVMLAVNILANALPLNGYNTGEVSAFYPNKFVPAGFTFSIWSVIYLLLLGWVIVSGRVLWKQERTEPGFQQALLIAPYFIMSCLVNASWIFAWHYLLVPVSLVLMLFFLGTLLFVYQKMQLNQLALTGYKRLFLYLPFIVYLAWICVATIANATALLVDIKWGRWGIEEWVWSCIMIVVALLLGVLFGFVLKEAAYAFVITWALFGVYKGQIASSEEVGYTALGATVLSLLAGIWGWWKGRNKAVIDGVL